MKDWGDESMEWSGKGLIRYMKVTKGLIDGRTEERLDGGRGDGKVSLVKEGEPGETRDEAIRCLCTREVESVEVVCCEIC